MLCRAGRFLTTPPRRKTNASYLVEPGVRIPKRDSRLYTDSWTLPCRPSLWTSTPPLLRAERERRSSRGGSFRCRRQTR